QEPLPMAFDQQGNRLLMLQPATGQQPARLVEVPEHGDGGLDAEATSAHDVSQFAVQQPLAMAVDAHSGALLILDGDGPRLIRALPRSDASSGRSASFDDAEISIVDIGSVAD